MRASERSVVQQDLTDANDTRDRGSDLVRDVGDLRIPNQCTGKRGERRRRLTNSVLRASSQLLLRREREGRTHLSREASFAAVSDAISCVRSRLACWSASSAATSCVTSAVRALLISKILPARGSRKDIPATMIHPVTRSSGAPAPPLRGTSCVAHHQLPLLLPSHARKLTRYRYECLSASSPE